MDYLHRRHKEGCRSCEVGRHSWWKALIIIIIIIKHHEEIHYLIYSSNKKTYMHYVYSFMLHKEIYASILCILRWSCGQHPRLHIGHSISSNNCLCIAMIGTVLGNATSQRVMSLVESYEFCSTFRSVLKV